MRVKETIKWLVQNVDEALKEASDQTDTAEVGPIPSANRNPQPRAASAYTSLAPVNAYGSIDTLISPNYVQILSPHHLEPAILEPFAHGQRQVKLIFAQDRVVMTATIESIHDTYLFVQTPNSTLFRKVDEPLLMSIPTQPDKSHILHLTVAEVFTQRLKLGYQDPRHEVRRQLRLQSPVLLRRSPPTVVSALSQQQTHVMRTTTWPSQDSEPAFPQRLIDGIYDTGSRVPSSYGTLLEPGPALACDLRDISMGGACLVAPGSHAAEDLLYRLVFLHILLPELRSAPPGLPSAPVTLDMFGVIRGVRSSDQSHTLHTRFLGPLPPIFGPYLEQLEHQMPGP